MKFQLAFIIPFCYRLGCTAVRPLLGSSVPEYEPPCRGVQRPLIEKHRLNMPECWLLNGYREMDWTSSPLSWNVRGTAILTCIMKLLDGQSHDTWDYYYYWATWSNCSPWHCDEPSRYISSLCWCWRSKYKAGTPAQLFWVDVPPGYAVCVARAYIRRKDRTPNFMGNYSSASASHQEKREVL